MSLVLLYPVIKPLHIGLALVSGGLFALRGAAVLSGQAWPLGRAARRGSVLLDTALLASALMLLAALQFAPLAAAWLHVKLALLVLYVVLGSLALRHAPAWRWQVMAYVAALACFGAMVAVAGAHDPAVLWHWALR